MRLSLPAAVPLRDIAVANAAFVLVVGTVSMLFRRRRERRMLRMLRRIAELLAKLAKKKDVIIGADGTAASVATVDGTEVDVCFRDSTKRKLGYAPFPDVYANRAKLFSEATDVKEVVEETIVSSRGGPDEDGRGPADEVAAAALAQL
jgi:hypothetical protein